MDKSFTCDLVFAPNGSVDVAASARAFETALSAAVERDQNLDVMIAAIALPLLENGGMPSHVAATFIAAKIGMGGHAKAALASGDAEAFAKASERDSADIALIVSRLKAGLSGGLTEIGRGRGGCKLTARGAAALAQLRASEAEAASESEAAE